MAEQEVARGASLERLLPIENRGRMLIRYQGEARVWLEEQRSRAMAAGR